MFNLVLIFIGAGFGGVMRFGISNAIYSLLGRQFPTGTLVVNVTGSFLMGLLFIIILNRFDAIGSPLRAFLLIGFLGGYTTFSSFSIETLQLLEQGRVSEALLNIMLNVGLCLLLTWFGATIAR